MSDQDKPKIRKGWAAAHEALEHDEISERLDAIAETAGMDKDDPRRLAILRKYLDFLDVHEEPPSGRVLHILTGRDLTVPDSEDDGN